MFLMQISITSELSWLHLSCDWYDKVNVIILFIWFQNYNWSGFYIEIKYSNFTYCYYFCIYMKSSEIWLIQFWFWDYPLLKHQNHWQWVLQNLTVLFFTRHISFMEGNTKDGFCQILWCHFWPVFYKATLRV